MPKQKTNRGQKQRDHDRRQMPDALEQTAEPDGQFPENAHGTLDDHQPGEDPGRGNDPNGKDMSLGNGSRRRS